VNFCPASHKSVGGTRDRPGSSIPPANRHCHWNDTSPLGDVDLGAALDTHSSVDGYLRDEVHQRRFQRGIALVNPGTAAVDVQLGQSYRTSGGSLVTQVTLAPPSGQVLQTP
jgi:hypothetical protein